MKKYCQICNGITEQSDIQYKPYNTKYQKEYRKCSKCGNELFKLVKI